MQDNLDFGKTEYLSERKAIVRRIKQQEDALDKLRERLGGSGGVSPVYDQYKVFSGFDPDKTLFIGFELGVRGKRIDDAWRRLGALDLEFSRVVSKHFTFKEQTLLYAIYHDGLPFSKAEANAKVRHGYVNSSNLLERFKSLFIPGGND